MSSVQAALAGEEQPENQFHRLPDDVVLHIFDKLLDAKSLCRCFIVSKRFASLIPQVHTVSIASTSWISNSSFDPRNVTENPEEKGFFGKFFNFLTDNFVVKTLRCLHQLIALPSLSKDFPALKFLGKMKQIRSLHVELPSYRIGGSESLFKWGTEFGTKLDSVTFLCGTSLREMTESAGEEENENEMSITRKEQNRRISLAIECIKDAAMRQAVLFHVVPEHPMLQSVVITDSKEKGVKLCLSGDKLVEFRNSINLRTMTLLSKRAEELKLEKVRVCYVPVLHLPMSGYVMKGVTLVKINVFADDDCDESTAMLDAFEEEEGAYLEAVVQILANHNNRIKTLFRN